LDRLGVSEFDPDGEASLNLPSKLHLSWLSDETLVFWTGELS